MERYKNYYIDIMSLEETGLFTFYEILNENKKVIKKFLKSKRSAKSYITKYL